MILQSDNLKISLEKDEIQDFWNIIAFALDWQSYALKNDKLAMTEKELQMAKELYEICEKIM